VSIRLIEYLNGTNSAIKWPPKKKEGLNNYNELFGQVVSHERLSSKEREGESGREVVMVYFIGGISLSEIAALRWLSLHGPCQYVIATTNIINSDLFLDSVIFKP